MPLIFFFFFFLPFYAFDRGLHTAVHGEKVDAFFFAFFAF
jgi:hypothetical protein